MITIKQRQALKARCTLQYSQPSFRADLTKATKLVGILLLTVIIVILVITTTISLLP